MNNQSKYTLISINPILQIAVKREIALIGEAGGPITYYVKGKQATHYNLALDEAVLLLPGWSHPFSLDNEMCQFGRKGDINIITGNPDMVRKIIEKNCNRAFTQHQLIKYCLPGTKEWKPLFKNVAV